MNNQGTMSDWIIALEQVGSDCLAESFRSQKLEDNQRLKESGLPRLTELIVAYPEYKAENPLVSNFFSEYDALVIRAIPTTQTLPRRYKKGIHSFEESQKFLEEVIEKGNESLYSVFLTEYEPQEYSGIIISRTEEVLIEISRAGLNDFSHGKVNPSAGGHFAEHNFNHFKSMRYTTNNRKQRKLIWQVLQYLREEDQPSDSDLFPLIKFKRGYFEWVITPAGKIKFLDYKTAEGYLR